MNTKTILLTGGRAPGTLELARFFFASGHTVHIAESFPYAFARASRAVKQFHIVSEPKNETEQFIEQLASIIQQEKIDLLIPTCEEIFYIAAHQKRLASLCEVFVDNKEQLRSLHNKYTFIEKATSLGLSVPKTVLAPSKEKLVNLIQENPFHRAVCKPVFSRFSTSVLFLPEDKEKKLFSKAESDVPWVYQERIDGASFCSYTICVNGQINAHTVYPSLIRAGDGATIHFQHIEHPKIQAWVKTFVEKTNFHGQLAFDFIENEAGEIFAIECNPRLTSGIHLFRGTALSAVFLGNGKSVSPNKELTVALKLAMLLYLLPNSRKMGFKAFVSLYKQASDVVYQQTDKKPFYTQLKSFYYIWKRSKKENISLLDATTVDIAWDGEEI